MKKILNIDSGTWVKVTEGELQCIVSHFGPFAEDEVDFEGDIILGEDRYLVIRAFLEGLESVSGSAVKREASRMPQDAPKADRGCLDTPRATKAQLQRDATALRRSRAAHNTRVLAGEAL